MSTPIPLLICELAEKDKVGPLNKLPALWVRQLDDKWLLVANGHRQSLKYNNVAVPPFHFYVEFDGWPAGMFDAYDGCIAAGSAANEETFIAALERAIQS